MRDEDKEREWAEGIMNIFEAEGRQERNGTGWVFELTAAADSGDLKPLIISELLKMGCG